MLSNVHFTGEKDLEFRSGGDVDHSTLVTLFKLLGYKVHVLLDQTAQVHLMCALEGWATLWGQEHSLLFYLLDRCYSGVTQIMVGFLLFLVFFFNFFLCLFLRERETQNPKQAPGSELSAQNPVQVSNSRAVRS